MIGRVELIADDDLLYRRLAPLHVKPDGSVNSAAFKLRGHPGPHVSVDLARLTTPQATLARAPRPGFGLGVLLARDPRSLHLTVHHDPLPANPALRSLKASDRTIDKLPDDWPR